MEGCYRRETCISPHQNSFVVKTVGVFKAVLGKMELITRLGSGFMKVYLGNIKGYLVFFSLMQEIKYYRGSPGVLPRLI